MDLPSGEASCPADFLAAMVRKCSTQSAEMRSGSGISMLCANRDCDDSRIPVPFAAGQEAVASGWDDRGHGRQRASEWCFDRDPQRGDLSRASRAGSLELNADRTVGPDVDQLEIAAIGDQSWPDPIQDRFDLFYVQRSGL